MDAITVFVTLGSVTTGGDTTFFVSGKDEPVFKIPFEHANFVMGELREVEHGTNEWNGKRITLSFYLHQNMLNFLKKKGSKKIFEEYRKLGFPRKSAIGIKYDSNLDSVQSCMGKWTSEVSKNTGNFSTFRKFIFHEKTLEKLKNNNGKRNAEEADIGDDNIESEKKWGKLCR